MSSLPEISVIIGSYNIAGYIERAIASALAQQGVNLEVIVVDDASRDQSVAVASAIKDSRLQVIALPVNGGPSAVRNAGIAAAKGSWIAILDGDDVMEPTRMARMLQLAQKNSADIVIDNLRVVSEIDGRTYPMFVPKLFNKIDQLDLPLLMRGPLTRDSAYPLSYAKPLFLKDFLYAHNLKYNASIRIGEDYLLLAEALASGAKCVIDHEQGYLYTQRAGSISHRISASEWAVMIELERIFEKAYQLDTKAQAAQNQRFVFMRDMQVYQLAVEGIKAKNLKAVIAALLLRPMAMRYFSEPLMKRMRKLFRRC